MLSFHFITQIHSQFVEPIFVVNIASICRKLGKDGGNKLDEFSEKFQRGGRVIFNPKIYVAGFGNFKQGLLSMKLIKKKSNFSVQSMFFNNCIDIN